jgi:tetratricopeptide (TPR) repeat protein
MDHKKAIKIGLICIGICLMGLSLIGTASSDDTNNVCYWDWTGYLANHIGEYNQAPAGYTYVVVDLYLKNEADTSIHTSPAYWKLIIGGIQYDEDSSTFSSSINAQSVDVLKGGEIETRIVYLVKGDPTSTLLKYDSVFGPTLKRINHYSLDQSGKYDEAIKAYDKAIDINPQNSTAWESKGLALDDLNKHEEAIRAFDKAIEINPQNSLPWDGKGDAFIKLGKSDEAMKAYNKALEIVPQDSIALKGKETLSKQNK